MRWTNNINRKLREKEKEREREIIDKVFFGIPALIEKKNRLIFIILTMGPGFLICTLPELKNSIPFLQEKSKLLFIIFSIGIISGLLARGFLKRLSERWKDVLSNFMKQKPEFPRQPFNTQKIFEKNHNWVVGSYISTLLIVFYGAVNIDYNSTVFSFSRSTKNPITLLAGFIFFSFTWGFSNLWMILRIECALSDVN